MRRLLPFCAALALAACTDEPGGEASDTAQPDATDATGGSGDADATSDTAPDPDTADTAADGAIDGSGASDATTDEGSADAAPPIPTTVAECFAGIMANLDAMGGPTADYDQYAPVVGSHCLGTNHQEIEGVEKVVFLGDSITVGTPPSWPEEYYRNVLLGMLEERFGTLEVSFEFAKFGARVDDLLLPPHQQILNAFPDVEPKRTLVIMTIGGNDVFKWAEWHADGRTAEEISALVDTTIEQLEEAIAFFRDEERFPNGVYVVFSNLFEFTDGTGDTTVCPLAATMGLTEPWPEGREPVLRFNEAVVRIAVETQTDIVFMLENFCGHGLLHEDPTTPCYRGPDTERWVDETCIHPNPAGHAQLARMFMAVVDE